MSLRFRSVVDRRDILRYAPWVRELKDRNGVYVIRDALDGDVYYVGESHSGRLYSTLTRHFQFWDGYTAGTTYDVRVLRPRPAARRAPCDGSPSARRARWRVAHSGRSGFAVGTVAA